MPENRAGIFDQIILFQTWMPLLGYGQQVLAAKDDPYKQAVIVGDALEWMASKTSTQLDDEVVKMISAIVGTPQAEALIRWVVTKAEGGA